MRYFDDMEDVEEWLEPLDWDAYWREVSTFDLAIQSRESCEELVANGTLDRSELLGVLKAFVRLEVIALQDLKPRDVMPWYALH